MKNEPTETELELLAALEAEDDPLNPADPELAEQVASESGVRALAEALCESRAALSSLEEPEAARFEQLAHDVMAEISQASPEPAPVEGATPAAEGWGARLRRWFSGLAIRPQYVALAAVALVVSALAIWMLQDNDSAATSSEESDVVQGDEELAKDKLPPADDDREKGLTNDDDKDAAGSTDTEDPEKMVAELDEALSPSELGTLKLTNDEVEPVELVASWDSSGWASSDGFGDYGLDGMSDAELEALDQALADL